MADENRFTDKFRQIEDGDFTQIAPETRATLEEITGPIDPRGICFGTEQLAIEKIVAGTLILASIRFAAEIEEPMHPQDAWAAGVISKTIDELLRGELNLDGDDEFWFPMDEFRALMDLAMTANELELLFITKPEGPLRIELNRLATEVPPLLGPPE